MISDTFCAYLATFILKTRWKDANRCTECKFLQIQTIQKIGGGEVGVVKNDDGIQTLIHTTLTDAWNPFYMRNVRKAMIRGEQSPL